MSQAKATLRLRRRRKAGPTLGAAGLSLSLAGGASAATGAAIADTPVCSSVAVSHELTLAEEEITDVGLATFRIAEKESTLRFRTRIVAGGCGACGSGSRHTTVSRHTTDPLTGRHQARGSRRARTSTRCRVSKFLRIRIKTRVAPPSPKRALRR
jgi:hypothetical protein